MLVEPTPTPCLNTRPAMRMESPAALVLPKTAGMPSEKDLMVRSSSQMGRVVWA